MVTVKVLLNGIDKVNDFVKITENYKDIGLDLVYGRYIVDATSLLGIFSLNLTNPIDLTINSDDEKVINNIKFDLKKFIVE